MINTWELESFYKGSRVLICGASGMTGRNLFELMTSFGAEVLGTQYSDDVGLTKVDFTSKEETDLVISAFKPEYVFICCAKTYNILVCKKNPQSMVLPNIQMVGNILDSCLENGVKKVLYISSATVYQPSYRVLSEEDLDLNKEPHDVYLGVGWMKRYVEKLCKFYSTLGLEVVIVRPTNIYGKYDKKDESISHVVPALICRALRKENPFVVWGNGLAVKDFIYVQDLVYDLATVMAKYHTPDPINVCSGELVNIRQVLFDIFDNLSIKYGPKIEFTSERHDAVPFRGISNQKFMALFGDRPYTKLREGIKQTVQWFSS